MKLFSFKFVVIEATIGRRMVDVAVLLKSSVRKVVKVQAKNIKTIIGSFSKEVSEFAKMEDRFVLFATFARANPNPNKNKIPRIN